MDVALPDYLQTTTATVFDSLILFATIDSYWPSSPQGRRAGEFYHFGLLLYPLRPHLNPIAPDLDDYLHVAPILELHGRDLRTHAQALVALKSALPSALAFVSS